MNRLEKLRIAQDDELMRTERRRKTMNKLSTILLILCATVLLSSSAGATLWDRGGGAIYDDVLNVTWLQDANLASSNSFGVAGISSDGLMDWDTANLWIDAMNAADYMGISNWRLPRNTPVNGVSYDWTSSFDGSTDESFNFTGQDSEMAYMFYENLGNLAFYDTSGVGPQAGWGLANTGFYSGGSGGTWTHFNNLQPLFHWSGSDIVPDGTVAWLFNFGDGNQHADYKYYSNYVWAVRDGDVTSVPEPGTVLLLGSGLIGLGLFRRRVLRKQL